MIDVASEFGVDSYILFPSSAASLGFMLFMQSLNDQQHVDTTMFKDSDTELAVPSFINSVPAKVFRRWYSITILILYTTAAQGDLKRLRVLW
ncbi:UDP-glycosyltransferase 71A27 [Euphorbia peplus]|nr:UDP-glycosyltransferase 71A27 [Euphorbia peplus]